MEVNKEGDRARKAAFLAKKDRENISKNGISILEYHRSGWSEVEIAAQSCESAETAIRIAAIRSFINQVNSIITLIKSHVEGLSAKEIAHQLNIELNIVLDELQWFQQSQIVTQKGTVWIHKKYE
jgi:DNA-binding NarL/FixJ family response regulator